MRDPVDRLRHAARRTRWTALAIGPVVGALGIAMAASHAVEGGFESLLANIALFVFAATAIALGAGMTYVAVTRSGRVADQLLATLQGDTSSLQRVEHLRRATGHMLPPERHQLRFHIGGERTSIDVAPSDVEPILAYVHHVAPHVEVRRGT